MKKSTARTIGYWIGVLGATLLVLAASWVVTCGIIKLVTLCFGWSFNWLIASGIWLVMILARSVFGRNITVEK